MSDKNTENLSLEKLGYDNLGELDSDIRWGLSFAIGSVALAGASAYATYEVVTGKNTPLAAIAVGSGVSLVGAATAVKVIPQTISLMSTRRSLRKNSEV